MKRPIKICGYCKKEWQSHTGGSGKRNDNRCDSCYVYRRKAETLYHGALSRSRKGLDFNLDIPFIEEKLRLGCPKTGESFVMEYGSTGQYQDRNPYVASLDKIDPAKGYTKDNVQVVSWIYNAAKQRLSDEEVLRFCRKVVNLSNMGHVRNAALVTI